MGVIFNRAGDKRRRLMQERSADLLRLIKRQASRERCVEAAEELRRVALGYYRAIEQPDCRKAIEWRERSFEQIVAFCVHGAGRLPNKA
jgi:hypothetical protein